MTFQYIEMSSYFRKGCENEILQIYMIDRLSDLA